MLFGTPVFLVLSFSLASAAPTEVHYKEGDKQPVLIHRRDTLYVDLDAVSDGGYSWSVNRSRIRHLKLIKSGVHVKNPVRQQEGQPPIVGQPTVTTFVFRAMSRGKSHLRLVYGRPWELKKGSKPDKKLDLDVQVR